MTNRNPDKSSKHESILSLLREADRKIEKWVFHLIDQIEHEN